MVNYAYADYFNKSSMEKDMLIVPATATVTPVTDTIPVVTDAEWEINTADLKSEEFSLDESLCSEDNLHFGLLESAEVNFTIKNKSSIPNMKGDKIAIYIWFDGDSDTLFKIGEYTVEIDKYSADRSLRNIKAYDDLYYLWDYDITEWYNKQFENGGYFSIQTLRENLFTWLNDPDGGDYPIVVASQDTDGSLNDDYLVGKTIESDAVTFGFFMSGLLEWRGCFGHINRNGEFECKWLVPYDEPAIDVISDDVRMLPTEYEDDTVWGIGYVAVFDRNNIRKFRVGSSAYKHPSVYKVVDSFVAEEVDRLHWQEDTKEALQVLRDAITHRRYKPCDVKCVGNLCLEVGDQIDVQYSGDDENPKTFYTYILERHFKGIQSFKDEYSAKGQRKQPKYQSNGNWHVGDSQSVGTSGVGTGGVSSLADEHDRRFCEIVRNMNIRFLNEPSNVVVEYNSDDMEVSITWNDPSDISSSEPVPITWSSTIVIRKEDSVPLNRYDGTVLVTSTTRDAYSETAFVDNTIEKNKKYYYGIFPIGTNGNVTFTKVMVVDTTEYLLAPIINSIERIA